MEEEGSSHNDHSAFKANLSTIVHQVVAAWSVATDSQRHLLEEVAPLCLRRLHKMAVEVSTLGEGEDDPGPSCVRRRFSFEAFVDDTMDVMHSIWKNFGMSSERFRDRDDTLFVHMEELLRKMQDEETERHAKLVEDINNMGKCVEELGRQLGLPPFVMEPDLMILQKQSTLSKVKKELEDEKASRLRRLDKLKEQLRALARALCTETHYVPLAADAIPTEEQLRELAERVAVLEAEKEQRKRTFEIIRRKVLELWNALERAPTTTFEKTVTSDSPDVPLSTENIKALQKLHEKLLAEEKQNRKDADELREKLASLWERLLVDETAQDVFLQANPGHCPQTIRALHAEIEKCNKLKMQNIQSFIDNLRKEIKEWWDICMIGREQREMFRAYYDETYSEDLLEVHDAELQKLKDYHQHNKRIFDLIKTREEMWKKIVEFENRGNDPSRYNNRGGGLLIEEKQRRALTSKFPAVEKELGELIMEWEKSNNKVFLVNGKRYVDMVEDQVTAHQAEKENARIERKARAKQTEDEPLGASKMLTPSKRKLGTPLKTPNTTVKRVRKIAFTPKTQDRVHSSLAMFRNGRRISQSAGKPPRGHSSRGTPYRTPRRAILKERNENQMSVSDASPDANRTSVASIASAASTYSDFADEIDEKAKKDKCRSSAMIPGKSPSKFPVFGTHGRKPFFI